MASKKNSGTMVLPTLTAAALWNHEILGQLSDGRWENSTPRNHHSFWCSLTVKVEPGSDPKVEAESYALRTKYNLRALFDLGKDCSCRYNIRDRMVRMGRMALALARLDRPMDHDHAYVAAHMPETTAEFIAKRNQVLATSKYDWEIAHWTAVTQETALVYYTQPDVVAYGLKQMKADVDLIKVAMMTVRT